MSAEVERKLRAPPPGMGGTFMSGSSTVSSRCPQQPLHQMATTTATTACPQQGLHQYAAQYRYIPDDLNRAPKDSALITRCPPLWSRDDTGLGSGHKADRQVYCEVLHVTNLHAGN